MTAAHAPNLQDHLRETGSAHVADQDHPCEKCGFFWPAFAHKDVRDNALIPHDFVCGQCHVSWVREMRAVWGSLGEPPVDWAPVVRCRREILNATMWATATDGTVDPEFQQQMLDWRRSIAFVGPNSHAHPREVIWPAMPVEAP